MKHMYFMCINGISTSQKPLKINKRGGDILHVRECATVMGTALRDGEQKGVCLHLRPENCSVICHGNNLLKTPA